MGRKVAMLWHASFSIGAGVLFFFFVLPRWSELMGDTSHTLGTALRIVAGVLIGLAALPVVFTLLRTRKPELGTPQLALSIRTWSIIAHVLAGVLIVGTAISEIWLSLDAAGHWLFGIYGAAAAIAVLGFFAFYLSFVAELPPPPPKPIKAKKPKKRDTRRKKGDHETEEAETEEAETFETEAAETPAEAPVAGDTEDTRAGLQNRRPTGKGSHRMRRKRSPGAVAVEE
jgi:MFS family permease